MQNRRNFLRNASLLVAGGVVAPQLLASCSGKGAASVAADKYIGLQLYSLREMVKDSGIQAVLEAVSKMGYKHVENAGYDDGKIYGLAPAEYKKMLDDNGLKCTSAHLGPTYEPAKEAELLTWWDKAIDAHNQLGVKYLIQPWMPVNDETKLDDLKRYCDYFSTVGLKTAASSIGFGYHNHNFEFKEIEGKLIYDFLLDNVSKNHVFFELDVYWCTVGAGKDAPVKYLTERSSQFKAIHIKDEKEIGASGNMDFKPIFDQMKAINIKEWFVEVEQYTNNDPVASVQQSYDYLAKAEYVY